MPQVSTQQYPHFMHLLYRSMTFLVLGDPTNQIQMMHGGKEQNRAHYAISQSTCLPKTLCTGRSLFTTHLWVAVFSTLWVPQVWHNTGPEMSGMGIPGKVRSRRSDIVSPVQNLLFCSNCMSWAQNFGILSFKSYFHCSFIPSGILTTGSVLSPFFMCSSLLKEKRKK